jgi:hypothetical protein
VSTAPGPATAWRNSCVWENKLDLNEPSEYVRSPRPRGNLPIDSANARQTVPEAVAGARGGPRTPPRRSLIPIGRQVLSDPLGEPDPAGRERRLARTRGATLTGARKPVEPRGREALFRCPQPDDLQGVIDMAGAGFASANVGLWASGPGGLRPELRGVLARDAAEITCQLPVLHDDHAVAPRVCVPGAFGQSGTHGPSRVQQPCQPVRRCRLTRPANAGVPAARKGSSEIRSGCHEANEGVVRRGLIA